MVDTYKTSSIECSKILTPYKHLAPTEIRANLRWRKYVVKKCCESKEYADCIRLMCARDIVFWFNTFAWTHNSKEHPSCPVRPFILFPAQEKALLTMCESMGKNDVVIEKSRQMGISWLCCGMFAWMLMYKNDMSFKFVSRNEEYVDAKDNMTALMPKIDFIFKRLPKMLAPPIERALCKMHNPETGTQIIGESTTGNAGRGGNYTALFFDEFQSFEQDGFKALAATADASNCRIFNGTPAGAFGAFYDRVQKTKCKIRLHWTEHSEKAKGLYFEQHTGKPRSPWYDRECIRRGSPMEIAQELDIEYHGAGNPFFDNNVITQQIERYAVDPVCRGRIENNRFVEDKNGLLVLWKQPDVSGRLPLDRAYSIGNDISMGTGASNSCMTIGDNKTYERVGEIVSAHLSPDEFASKVLEVAYWLNGDKGLPFVIWEANGPGRSFEREFIKQGYMNIYFRTNEKDITKKVSNQPGWSPTPDNKKDVFIEYRRALAKGDFVNRSKVALEECKEYVINKAGGVDHHKNINIEDSSGARDNHGDRVVADALCNWVIKKSQIAGKPEDTPVEGTIGYRIAQAAMESKVQQVRRY